MTRIRLYIAVILTIVILSLVGLALFLSKGRPSVTSTGNPEMAPPTRTDITLDPSPRPTGSQKKDNPARVSPVPSAQPTPVSASDGDLQNLSLYRSALRPEFIADLEALPEATRYFIQLTLSPDDPRQLTGVQRVRYTNAETVALDSLYFRLYPNLPGYGGLMSVERVLVNGTLVETSLEAEGSALRVPMDPPLAPGAVIELMLWFQESVPTDTSAGYGLYAFTDEVYALPGFYPTIPVYDDEGWNVEVASPYGDATFTDVAFYQVHLTVPADLTVVSSGSTLEAREDGEGRRTWVAVAGPMRDFYVAMSADYDVVSKEVDGTLVNSYYRSTQAEGGQLALQFATDALREFSERFGPYPYAELDVVATPTNAGGIEYPGAIVVAQELYDQDGGLFEMATAHEVAHQWWYGLVGSDQLDEPWLDESLTNYSALLYFEETAGSGVARTVKELAFEGPYRAIQQDERDRGVAGPVAGFSERDYGDIVYGKGPLFFDSVRDRLGDEAFFGALGAYLQAHRYGVAYPDDLLVAFEETSGQQIDDLYESWILGE